MNYELALKLKKARFPQGLSPNSEYYIAPNIIMRRKDIFQDVFHDNPREMTTTNEFIYKPRLEELTSIDWPAIVDEWIKNHE